MLVLGITIALVYLAIVAVIALAIRGAGWSRRRGIEMREGEWLPWHPWLRRHPLVSACVLAVLNAVGLVVSLAAIHHWAGGKKLTGYGFAVIAAGSVFLGLVAYFYKPRDRQARQ